MKCKNCAKEITQHEFCSKKCEIDFNNYVEKVAKYKNVFLTMIFLPVLLMPIFNNVYFDLLIVFYLGIILNIFPFTTPQLIRVIGLKKAITCSKIIGFSLIAISIIILCIIGL